MKNLFKFLGDFGTVHIIDEKSMMTMVGSMYEIIIIIYLFY
jgi:hypothetical protein